MTDLALTEPKPSEVTPPHHRLAVDRMLGALHLQADLPLHAPWTLLFGPSGSGKSSLLRAACGLLGHEAVYFSRRASFPQEAHELRLIAPGHATPPYRLALGYAPQQGALFPHLSVAENIRFALTVQRNSAADSIELDEFIEMFELTHLRTRRPNVLSGGERQRVNLARAFAVPGIRLLLLDEPFSALGRELRDRLLARMVAWTRLHSVPVLSVSHDVDEALLLGADVVVLEQGKIVRRGTSAEALQAERERLLQSLQPKEPLAHG